MSFLERNQEKVKTLQLVSQTISHFIMPLKWKYFIRKTKRIFLRAPWLPDVCQVPAGEMELTWQQTLEFFPLILLVPWQSSHFQAVARHQMCLTSLAPKLLHDPLAIHVKEFNSCPLLVTICFKIPLIIFFHRFSSCFLFVVRRPTTPSPLVSEALLFPPERPSWNKQEDLIPYHRCQEAPTLTSVVHELSQ